MDTNTTTTILRNINEIPTEVLEELKAEVEQELQSRARIKLQKSKLEKASKEVRESLPYIEELISYRKKGRAMPVEIENIIDSTQSPTSFLAVLYSEGSEDANLWISEWIQYKKRKNKPFICGTPNMVEGLLEEEASDFHEQLAKELLNAANAKPRISNNKYNEALAYEMRVVELYHQKLAEARGGRIY